MTTVDDNARLINRFLAYMRIERGASENTISSYGTDLRKFSEWLDRVLVSAKTSELHKYLAELLSAGRTSSTVARRRACLCQFYRFLCYEEEIEADPARHLPIPKGGTRVRTFLSTDEVERMVSSLGTSKRGLRNKAMLLLFFSSGLRASELAALKLADLDFEAGCAKVWNGKGGKDGIVPLSPRAIAALQAFLEVRHRFKSANGSPYVFPGKNRPSLTRENISQQVRKIGKEAIGRDISPHSLRRAFASVLLKGGADIRDVQALMRHAGVDTTALYIEIDLDDLRRAYYGSHPRARFAKTTRRRLSNVLPSFKPKQEHDSSLPQRPSFLLGPGRGQTDDGTNRPEANS